MIDSERNLGGVEDPPANPDKLDAAIRRYDAQLTASKGRALLGVGLGIGLLLMALGAFQAHQDSRSTRGQVHDLQRATALIGTGEQLVRVGQRDSAIAAYQAAIALNSSNPIAFNLCGYAFLLSGKLDSAIEYLRRSVVLDSAYVWGHYNLALAYWRAGDTLTGAAEVQKAVALSGDIAGVIESDKQFACYAWTPLFQEALGGRGGSTASRISQVIAQGCRFTIMFTTTIGTIEAGNQYTGYYSHNEHAFTLEGANGQYPGGHARATYGCTPAQPPPGLYRGPCVDPLRGKLDLWGAVFSFDDGDATKATNVYVGDGGLAGTMTVSPVSCLEPTATCRGNLIPAKPGPGETAE